MASRSRFRASRLALAGAVLAGLAGWRCHSSSDTLGPYPKAPVILISIDTLRADHLPLYGFPAGSTPAIDAFGREALLFEDAYSHCPQTLPAHASMLTGLLPPHHEVRDNIGFTLKDSHRTLATRFKAAGFTSGAAVSAYVLRAATGISRGFDFYDDAIVAEGGLESVGSVQRDGAVAVDLLGRWIEEQGDRRFFAFLHLYEPHTPYAPPERHRGHASLYDGDVSYADELVGRFLDRLRSKGLLDRAIVALTSDHGEGLNDHGEQEHGIFLYREAVHVPLLLRLPGHARGGTRLSGVVAQVDLPATLLDLAGVAADGLDGVSLRPLMRGQAVAVRPVYSESLFPRYHFGWSELYAATDARYRYIKAPRPELFDVGRDPGEKTNIVAAKSVPAAMMNDWLERKVGIGKVNAPEEVPAETREKLQALGYIGTASEKAASATDLPDPKDKIASYEDLKAALGLRQAGRLEEAVAGFKKVLADNPGMVDAWEMMGLTLLQLQRDQEAVAAFVKALAIDPARAETNMALAKVYALGGKPDLAIKHAEVAAGKNPGSAYEVLAEMMMDRGRTAEAAAFARKSIAADDQRMMSHFVLGVVAQKAGRFEEALAAFRRADQARQRQKHGVIKNLHYNMADCLARLGREPEAEQEFKAEIETIPFSREGRTGLAMLYRSQGRDAEARAILSGLIAADPHPTADTYWTVVRTFAVLGDAPAAQEWAARARGQFPSDPRFRGPDGPPGPRSR